MATTEPRPPQTRPDRQEPPEPAELLESHAKLLEQLTTRSIHGNLAATCRLIDDLIPGATSAVMIWDARSSCLRLATAPGLSQNAQSDLSELTVWPGRLSSGAAYQTGEPVFASPLGLHDAWSEHAEGFEELGIKACWSTPIHGPDGTAVIGTLDLYFQEERPEDARARNLLDAAARLTRGVLTRARMVEGLIRQSEFDPLTGLPNRATFGRRLREIVQQEREDSSDYRFAVVAVDIDQLKNINDTLGFNMGDYLLRAVGQRLVSVVRKNDTVARTSGDEFLLLLGDLHRNEDVATIAEKIREAINEPYDFDGQGLFVTATIGISVYPWDGEDAQTLLRNAETALNFAKDMGGGGFQMFRPTMVRNKPTFEDWWQRSKLTNDLRDALEREEFELFYQLKYDPTGKKALGAEALIRWHHPELGLLLPGRFISIAEQTGLIVPIGQWAMEEACRQNKQWRASGLLRHPISVNVTAHQFRRQDFVDQIKGVIQETGLQPEAIELEITESVAMEDGHQTLQRLQALSDLGVKLTIDDFGTGFSSLSYLNRFPIDTLKIDRSFIKDIGMGNESDQESRSIVLAVLSIARSLGLEVVAEGVETQDQLDFLNENQCDQIQGFLLARPRDAETVTQTLIKRS